MEKYRNDAHSTCIAIASRITSQLFFRVKWDNKHSWFGCFAIFFLVLELLGIKPVCLQPFVRYSHTVVVLFGIWFFLLNSNRFLTVRMIFLLHFPFGLLSGRRRCTRLFWIGWWNNRRVGSVFLLFLFLLFRFLHAILLDSFLFFWNDCRGYIFRSFFDFSVGFILDSVCFYLF